MLGEVYARMLPSRGPADSLSEKAFLRARALDPDFAPALLHLERLAISRGDLPAVRRLSVELKSANADTSHAFERELMVRCLEQRLSAADWSDAVKRDLGSVVTAGKFLSAGGKQPGCARAAFQSMLRADTAIVSRAYRWASQLILNGVDEALSYPLKATGAGAQTTDDPWPLLALRDRETADLDRARRRVLDSLVSNPARLRTDGLWYLGLIAFRLRDSVALVSIQRAVESRADSTGARADKLVAAEGSARLSLLRGDSTRAIEQLMTLRPSGRRSDITWKPWESLGAERMMLAELLFARGDARRAIDIATLIDAPEPVAYLYWLRSSLRLRVRAAEQLHNTRLAESYRARLSYLDVNAARVAVSRPTQ